MRNRFVILLITAAALTFSPAVFAQVNQPAAQGAKPAVQPRARPRFQRTTSAACGMPCPAAPMMDRRGPREIRR